MGLLRCGGPDFRTSSQNRRQQIVVIESSLALLRCGFAENFNRQRKKPLKPDILPNQPSQLVRGEAPDGATPQAMHSFDQSCRIGWRIGPSLSLKFFQ
ncbi:hypothetical protein GCM10009549_48980 [Streptomyces thermoalcalitolerans]|uniref:Uncharacterized protein n=1 Tax=Streptomyces thermoalcalitolerans TaxID=65605 RepID=A0ABN1PEZ0_9ACTN